MKNKHLIFVGICCLVFLMASSCQKSKKMEVHESIPQSEEFSTDLSDGEYLIDSSAGVKTYAVVEGKKLKKFRAVTLDGKESNIGYVNLQFVNQAIIDGPTAKEKCLNKGCIWGCLAPISTSSSALICNCVCPGDPPTPSQSIFGMMNVDMLGPSFRDTKISSLNLKLTLALDSSSPQE